MTQELLKLARDCIRDSIEYKQGKATAIEAVEDIDAALKSVPDGAQPQQEPVAWISKHGVVYPLDAKEEVHPINDLQPLYTSPPQSKPLTDEKIDKTHETQVWDAIRSYARAIETKPERKNRAVF